MKQHFGNGSLQAEYYSEWQLRMAFQSPQLLIQDLKVLDVTSAEKVKYHDNLLIPKRKSCHIL